MAAPKYTDRVLAQEVRTLTLKEIKKVLVEEEMSEFKKALLIRLAGSVLPRLNEVTGEGGEAIKIEIAGEIADKNQLYGYATPSHTITGSEGSASV